MGGEALDLGGAGVGVAVEGNEKSWPSVRTPSTSKMRTLMRRARSSGVRVEAMVLECYCLWFGGLYLSGGQDQLAHGVKEGEAHEC